MVAEVNKFLPVDQQFSQVGWYSSKYERLKREYKRLYPDGNLWKRFCISVALMFAFALAGIWAISR
jgi:hypothetical protein